MVKGLDDSTRDAAFQVALKAEADPRSVTPEQIRRLAAFVREVVKADLTPGRPPLTEEQKAGLETMNKFGKAGKKRP